MLDSRLKLRHLQALVTVHGLRSVQASAHELSRTPSAVSKSIAELEGIVGTRLFERTRRGLLPTPAADRLLTQVHRGLALLGDALGEASGAAAAAGPPTVTLGYCQQPPRRWRPERCCGFTLCMRTPLCG